MRMVKEVVEKARNKLGFGNECRPVLLARQLLLESCRTVEKLEDVDIDKAVDVFETKWKHKVCCPFVHFLVEV